jgi:hypothetical protein
VISSEVVVNSNITPNFASFDVSAYEEASAIIEKWDFSLMREKMQEPSHAGWTLERIDAAIIDYKRYMAITKALDGYQLVPNGEIDRIWHEHILDTRQYSKDCLELFGGFLHHYPYFGMRGESDKSQWEDTSTLSNDFWTNLFGESLYNDKDSAMKCPQSCPGVSTIQITHFEKNPMKCPQACPGKSIDLDIIQFSKKYAMKCPQSCPGVSDSIDYDYAFLKIA